MDSAVSAPSAATQRSLGYTELSCCASGRLMRQPRPGKAHGCCVVDVKLTLCSGCARCAMSSGGPGQWRCRCAASSRGYGRRCRLSYRPPLAGDRLASSSPAPAVWASSSAFNQVKQCKTRQAGPPAVRPCTPAHRPRPCTTHVRPVAAAPTLPRVASCVAGDWEAFIDVAL